jgi:hypothetical protein
MTAEANIDAYSINEAGIGDKVGSCDGVVIGFTSDGTTVNVEPEPRICDHCPLSEYCTESKAE